MKCIVGAICLFSFIGAATIERPSQHSADSNRSELKRRLLQAISAASKRGPESYVVRSQSRISRKNGLWTKEWTEIKIQGEMLRILTRYDVKEFEPVERPAVNAYLINSKGAYKLSKGSTTDFFVLWRAVAPIDLTQKRQLSTQLGVEMANCASFRIAGWFADWIVVPAILGRSGFELVNIAEDDSGFSCQVACSVDALEPFGYREAKRFDVRFDQQGRVTRWSCGYDQKYPSKRYTHRFAWADGHLVRAQGELKDGEKVLSRFEDVVSDYSSDSIPREEFSLEYFGHPEPWPRIPLLWPLAAAVVGLCGCAIGIKRKFAR